MPNAIKELRKSTNKTQKEFATTYNIPLSTLKKWEQDESKPAPYVLSLLSSSIDREKTLIEISDVEHSYYYNELTHTIYNKKGDAIKVDINFREFRNKGNLMLCLDRLFECFEKIRDDFNNDCKFYSKEDKKWAKMN